VKVNTAIRYFPVHIHETSISRELFLDSMYKSLIRIEGDRFDARFDHDSLPREEDMDRILRYEERMHRQIDWAINSTGWPARV
jgi:hypothetical protein